MMMGNDDGVMERKDAKNARWRISLFSVGGGGRGE
jgi:hypothetical protein